MRIPASLWTPLVTILTLSQLSVSETVEIYDYIIVGAGTCGLLLANRLSQDANIKVAIIDPGEDQRQNPNVTDPLAWVSLISTPVNWNYSSIPQVNADGRILQFLAGKGIGGTSLINGMTYVRGDKAQFDAWEDLGNPGWNWGTMLEYYKKVEKFFAPETWQATVGALYKPEYHGFSGDLHVGFNPYLQNGSFYASSKTSWATLGQGVNTDASSGETKGFDVWPQTLDPIRKVRWDAATSFYWPVQHRQNLKLYKGTVSQVLWKSPSKNKKPIASGVEYFTSDNKRKTLKAAKEVIISAGSLRTPLILELSGIGNPKLLKKLGIKTVVHAPGVGENLIDQPNNGLMFDSKVNLSGYVPYATFVNASSLFGRNVKAVAASTRASLSNWARQVAETSDGALTATALEHQFRIQHDLMFKKGVTVAEILTLAVQGIVLSTYWGLMPFSRGSVHLGSANEINNPSIDPKFFSVDLDMTVEIATGRLSRKFFETAPVSAFVGAALSPNNSQLPLQATDEQWESFSLSSFMSNSHPIGTAAMMAKELGGVVDPELKVYGTSNVRVVDASVLPMQISGHLTATLYAIAQRAAEMILKAHDQ